MAGARGRRSKLVVSQLRQPRHQDRSPPPDLPPVRTGVPPEDAPGLQFLPTDEDLVVFYLRRYVAGQPLPKGVVVPADVYGTEPWKLFQEGKEEGFFFARRTRRTANSRWPSRTAGGGSWQTYKGEEEIKSAKDGVGEITVGIKNSLSFKNGEIKYSGWIMYEYELLEAEDRREKFQEHVLCHVKRSRIRKAQQRKQELATPAHDGDTTVSSGCNNDPCAPTITPFKKTTCSSAGAGHANETTWTPSSSSMLNSAAGVDQVEPSMIPAVAADHKSHYSSFGESTATPLPLQEIQVQIPASNDAVEQNDITSCEEDRLVISMDELFDLLDGERCQRSEEGEQDVVFKAQAAACHESFLIHDQTLAAPSLSSSSMAAAEEAEAERSVESKE